MVNHIRNNRLLAQAVSNRRKQNYLETVVWAVTAQDLPDMVIPADTATVDGCINGIKVAYNRYNCELIFGADIQVLDGSFIFTGDNTEIISTVSWPGTSHDQFSLLINYLSTIADANYDLYTTLFCPNSTAGMSARLNSFVSAVDRIYITYTNPLIPVVHGRSWNQDNYTDLLVINNGGLSATTPAMSNPAITLDIAVGYPIVNSQYTFPLTGKISYIVFDDKEYTTTQINAANELMGKKIGE